jgi:hypothetical protein
MRPVMSARLIAITMLTLGAAGCVGGPPVDESDDSLTPVPLTAFANDKPAYDFFVGKGLTNFQAAGIVGNLDQESGVNPSSVQAGGPGRGIAQWSVGGRWDTSNPNVLAYAKSKGVSATTLNVQLEFIWLELTTVGYGYTQLKATTNVTDATLVFMDKYEICGTCVSTQRISYAKSVLAAYGAAPPYSATFVSQSWPYASQPAMTIKCGQDVAANIVLKNTGTKTWDQNTRLGTTMHLRRQRLAVGEPRGVGEGHRRAERQRHLLVLVPRADRHRLRARRVSRVLRRGAGGRGLVQRQRAGRPAGQSD